MAKLIWIVPLFPLLGAIVMEEEGATSATRPISCHRLHGALAVLRLTGDWRYRRRSTSHPGRLVRLMVVSVR